MLSLDGVVDLSTLPILHDHLRRHVADHDAPVVDLDGLIALDDCGLGLLLGAAGRCRETGRELVIITTRWLDRLAITGMDRAVTVRTSLTDDR